MESTLPNTIVPFDPNVGSGFAGNDGYGLTGALDNHQRLGASLTLSRATSLTNLEINNLLAEPTIVAIAQGNPTPPTARYPNTVTNGDFLLGGNEIATLVGDGLDEFTTWTFDLTRDPDFTDLTDTTLLASAELTLTLKPTFGIDTDGITIQGLGSIVQPIRELPAGETRTITIDLLDYFSPDTVLQAVRTNTGRFSVAYQDDAIVSFAKLELSIFDSGIFTVGNSGQVGIDFLFDGGAYEGDLALFSLEDMDTLKPGSKAFIKEAARRALTNSTLGHVVISDPTEGARFSGELPYEGNFNDGAYTGSKTFLMNPGDRFGLMLIPDGWTSEVFRNPVIGGSRKPLFSMSTTDPDDALDGKQFAWVVSTATDNNAFAFEDLSLEGNSDRDYNDVLFQVRGATGRAQAIDGAIVPEKDWRSSSFGAAIIARLELEDDLGLVGDPIDVGNGVWFLGTGIHPDDLRIIRPNNINAADTTNTDQLWAGGGLGLNLDGNGLTVGIWEAGDDGTGNWRIRNTHVELAGRTVLVDTDQPNGFSNHATHVAGTIGAAGINANARGMANQVNLRSYSSANDLAELVRDAGLIVASNHSYGSDKGWLGGSQDRNTINVGLVPNTDVWLADRSSFADEDPGFGEYGERARDLDQVLLDNPNLLSVWSASNDRNDGFTNANNNNSYVTSFGANPNLPGFNWVGAGWYLVPIGVASAPGSDGNGGTGYDSLPDSAAKNTLVVGAIQDITVDPYNSSNVVMTNFSSWGPTDDGRIKPDVVANGFFLNSSIGTADTAYDSFSGTSMAAPNVTGTAVLLIQHYQNLFGTPPRSATTKGLLIHTATDAGNAGPDYQFGWGVVDAAGAATFLTDAQNPNSQFFLRERTYEGAEQIIAVQSNGVEPLKVTITWTDPPGTPQGAGLDIRTPVLVNDLDIRVIGSDGTIYYPWTLDPANPGATAGLGINNVDNVEQVLFTPPTAGTYQIRISHKGAAFTQDYSLLASGAQFIGDIFEGVHEGGQDWGSGLINSRGVTSISSGDVDSDGNDEIAVGRNSGDNARFYLLNFDSGNSFTDLLRDQGGRGWGDSRGVTSLAFGDVDGDGNAELAVGRDSGDSARFYLFDYVNGGLVDLLGDQGGRGWGDSRGVTSLAFGDVDGDGNAEVAVGRNDGDNTRFYLFDYVNGDLVDLLGDQGGRDWGDSRGVTSLSFGDIDGDGNAELAVGRNSGENARFYLFDYVNGGLVDLLGDQGGRGWGDSRGVTSLAFGDVDGDGNAELAVGRNDGDNARFYLFDYANGGLVDLLGDQGGSGWGDNRGVISLAFGDIDGDGNAELAVGRDSGDNARYFIFGSPQSIT